MFPTSPDMTSSSGTGSTAVEIQPTCGYRRPRVRGRRRKARCGRIANHESFFLESRITMCIGNLTSTLGELRSSSTETRPHRCTLSTRRRHRCHHKKFQLHVDTLHHHRRHHHRNRRVLYLCMQEECVRSSGQRCRRPPSDLCRRCPLGFYGATIYGEAKVPPSWAVSKKQWRQQRGLLRAMVRVLGSHC